MAGRKGESDWEKKLYATEDLFKLGAEGEKQASKQWLIFVNAWFCPTDPYRNMDDLKYSKFNPYLHYNDFRVDYSMKQRFYLATLLSVGTLFANRWGVIINPVTISMVCCPEFYTVWKGPFRQSKR